MLNHEKIAELVRRKPGVTETEIAVELFGHRGFHQRVRSDCRWLVWEGRLERRGGGGPDDPYRYHPVESQHAIAPFAPTEGEEPRS